MSLRQGLFYGALLILATWVAWSADPGPSTSEVPSVHNPAPSGLEVLFTFLHESGTDVEGWEGPFVELPERIRTLVITAPVARALSAREVNGLRERVTRGLRLIYLAPTALDAQPALNAWLGLERAARFSRDSPDLKMAGDPFGTTLEIWRQEGLLAGLQQLRVGVGHSLNPVKPGWVSMAGKGERAGVLARTEGQGDVWVFSGPEVAENNRLELLDNLALWEAVASAGPVAFDESLHHPGPGPPRPVALGWVIFQLGLAGVFWVWAKGARLGPPRWEPVERQRSTLEYLEALGRLTRKAQVEPELLAELATRMRHSLWERLGISLTLSDADATRGVAARTGLEATELAEFFRDVRALTPGTRVPAPVFLALSQRAAEWSARIS